tara:strand:- start:563 stop:781 length:219 start_codon:yes stop_codon:yes gene_type:complete
MMKKSSPKYGNFTSSDRLLSHWKERRQAARRNQARRRTRDSEKMIDPDFDDVALDDLIADFGLGPAGKAEDS